MVRGLVDPSGIWDKDSPTLPGPGGRYHEEGRNRDFHVNL